MLEDEIFFRLFLSSSLCCHPSLSWLVDITTVVRDRDDLLGEVSPS